MEETSASDSEVRLVRCPKCGNLLPESPDLSIYTCGGCGAVLRAKRKGLVEDGLSEISDVCENDERVDSGFGSNRALGNLDVYNCSTSRSEIEAVLADPIGSRQREPISICTSFDYLSVRDRFSDRDEYESRLDLDDWAASRNDVQACMGDHKYVDSNFGSLSSGTGIEKWRGERNASLSSQGAERKRMGMNFAPLKERSQEYGMGSSYGTGDHRGYDGFNGFDRVVDLESDRAELLRKIEELEKQLVQSCDVGGNPRERVGVEPRMSSTPFDPYRSHNVYGANKQPLAQGHRVLGPPYVYEDEANVPYKTRHGSIVQDSYPAAHYRHGMVQYGTHSGQIITRPPYRPYQDFPQMYHNEYHDSHMDVNSRPLRLNPQKSPFHRHECSCSQCFTQNRKVPPADPIFYHHKNFASRGYTSEDFIPPNMQFFKLSRSSSGHSQAKFDLGHRNPPRKVIVAHGNGQVCRAISGGAPFITCCNCFELLKLPWKPSRVIGKNHNKMRCGACSSILLYELSGKGIILSVPKQIEKSSLELADGFADMPNKGFESSHGHTNSCSNYDDNNVGVGDAKSEPFPGNQKSNSDESGKRQGAHSLSSSFSEHENIPGIVVGKDDSLPVEFPSKDDVSLPFSDSPHHHHYISSDDAADRSMNESVNSGVSLEFSEVCKDDNRLNDQNESESFFTGLTNRGFGELSRSSQNSVDRRSNVFVNGQLIPGSEVKRAEKSAGPIQLGEYWYDVRAGFWGVMGHPCLGIIPPNIEEFNYPMPKNCAAGNTGVFINGRELHQKDLNLLANRGLPIIKNKSYLVEISGKVVDEQTGEELDSLGKLAPTIERVKTGFGMKVPKSIAEQLH